MNEGWSNDKKKKNYSPYYQHKLYIYNPCSVQYTQNCHFLFHLFQDVTKNDVPSILNYLLKMYNQRQIDNENVKLIYRDNFPENTIHSVELFLFLNR